jgi:hypothetical protein
MPQAYHFIRERDPDAAILEAPLVNTGWWRTALCTYWQSLHGLRTSAGYTADLNPIHEVLISVHSPFHALRMALPDYLKDDSPFVFEPIGLAGAQRFEDYAWLYLKAFGFDYVVLHRRPEDYPGVTVRVEPIAERLDPAKVFEDEETAVYQTDLLPRPSSVALMCAEGWRGYIPTRYGSGRIVDPVSTLALYNPDPDRPIVLAMKGMTRRPARVLELREGDRVLARWRVERGDPETLVSPPLRLSEGLHRLTLVCDGVEPDASHVPHFARERAPYGFWISALGFGPTREVAASWEAVEAVIANESDASPVR